MEHPTFSKEDRKTLAIALAVVLIVAPMVPRLLGTTTRSQLSYLRYLPESMVDTTTAGENAIGGAYLSAAYAVRDLSAAAYGGIAQQIVDTLVGMHQAQLNAYTVAGTSMSDGADQVGGAYEAITQWYGASNQRIQQRLNQQTP
jgi:hypothetical protein